MNSALWISLLLVMIANGAPVLAQHVAWLKPLAVPLDGHWRFVDGRALLGASKTWRGLLTAVAATGLVAWLIGYSPLVGVVTGSLAMLGDALSSFIKRRLGLRPSAMALGLDQIPESLLPLIYLQAVSKLSWGQVMVAVLLFVLLELLLSRFLYWLSIRKRPY